MTRPSGVTARFWQAQFALWPLYGAVHYAATLPLIEPDDHWAVAGQKALHTLIGVGVSAPLPALCRQMLVRRIGPGFAAVIVGAVAYGLALGWILIDRVATTLVATRSWSGIQVRWTGFPAGVDADAVLALVVVGAMYVVLWSWDDAARHRQATLEHALAAQAARFESLSSQLRPHFLLNTLAALRGVIAEDGDRARSMVSELACFLRITLSADDSHTLADELALVQAYLAIERVRFERALAVDVHVDPGAVRCALPSLVLQPLVENALKHGVPDAAGTRHLRIRAQRHGEHLRLEVANPGTLPPGSAHVVGLGTRLTRDRLAHVFGDRHRFVISESAGWVVAQIDVKGPVTSLKALIVDDEPPARRDLIRLLGREGGVDIVGEAGDLASAESALSKHPPDVVFLDLRLGDGAGFELLPRLPLRTAVVIVTAYEEYAIKAFETNTLDYVLKPVEPARLALALDRVRARRSAVASGVGDQLEGRTLLPDRVAVNDWLLLRDGGRDALVRTSSIACITAEGDYTRVGTADGKTRLVHRSLREWEARLPAPAFERVHRSAIVNLRHVVAVDRRLTTSSRVEVCGHPALPISRRAAARLRRSHD